MSFKQIESLGMGAFGIVKKYETPENRPYHEEYPIVAIKHIKNPSQDAEKEVELLKELQHEHIVRYLESFISKDGDLCIVMEFCNQGTLSQFLEVF